ncbi:hypothetical protein C4J98_3044 [Pseudomonas orientalis]|nr:hypothetical protein C4J98_3044 [Pseudomonas orientalis]
MPRHAPFREGARQRSPPAAYQAKRLLHLITAHWQLSPTAGIAIISISTQGHKSYTKRHTNSHFVQVFRYALPFIAISKKIQNICPLALIGVDVRCINGQLAKRQLNLEYCYDH